VIKISEEKHWLFRDVSKRREKEKEKREVPFRATLLPYIEAARVKPLWYELGEWVKVKWLRNPQLVVDVTPEGYYRVWDEWEVKWHEVTLDDIERPVTPNPKAPPGSPEEMASRIVDVKALLEELRRGRSKKTATIRHGESEVGPVYLVKVDGEEYVARDVPDLIITLINLGIPKEEIEKRYHDIKLLGLGEELSLN
jgi:hypothetical protein